MHIPKIEKDIILNILVNDKWRETLVLLYGYVLHTYSSSEDE